MRAMVAFSWHFFQDVLLLAALSGVAVTLTGCGSSPSPTPSPDSPTPAPTAPPKPKPAGPVDCSKDLSAAQCSKCYFTGGATGVTECQACYSPYSLVKGKNSTAVPCAFDCSSYQSEPKPGVPNIATDHNGVKWPGVCFDGTEEHFFTIGDWGGVCNWGGQPCHKDAATFPGLSLPGKPWPMPNRHGAPLVKTIDYTAQVNVSDQMIKKAKALRNEGGKGPLFLLNVGDNFYPGGIEKHCGTKDTAAAHQFSQVFEDMYPASELGSAEWWSVLGNHDYGGVCYIGGWDLQIFYTWASDRWVMPGQYWKRHVQFTNFDVDIFFLDTNVYDTMPSVIPDHNICGHGRGEHCGTDVYPDIPGNSGDTCPTTGPKNPTDCHAWFLSTWKQEFEWLNAELEKSIADWKIVVTHYPAAYAVGRAEDHSYCDWRQVLDRTYGVDLMVTGHTHFQKIFYHDPHEDMGDTAHVITGGGGGVTSEISPPFPSLGHDDSYGFMDMKITAQYINITSISYGGHVQNTTMVYPHPKGKRRRNQKVQSDAIAV